MAEFAIPELLTPGEVAQLFRVQPKTVTRWANKGWIRSIRTIGGHRRFYKVDIIDTLEGSFAETSTALAANRLFTVSDFRRSWPMSAHKVELDDGHPFFEGRFTAEDLNAARRAFPGRLVTVDESGMTIHTSICGPETCSRWELGEGHQP
jgi:excisionase family DNA binding protein